MALTGFILFGFLLGHMAGNLQVFAGPENWTSTQSPAPVGPPALACPDHNSRGCRAPRDFLHSTLVVAARSSTHPIQGEEERGLELRLPDHDVERSDHRILRHLPPAALHLGCLARPLRASEPLREHRLQLPAPAIAIFYIGFMLLLSLRLYHGLWSIPVLGMASPRYRRAEAVRQGIHTAAAAGFIAVPVSCCWGWCR